MAARKSAVAWASLYGAVLDVDSDRLAASDEDDARGLERIAAWLADRSRGASA
jgi:putative methionine-R-sulfoxide reductase with GAF domain